MRRLLLAAVCLALSTGALSTGAAAADPAAVREVMEEARLIGTWGLDCQAMASSTDWEQIIVDERGVVQSIVGGDDSIWTYDIIDAEILLGGDVRMTFQPVEAPGGEDARGQGPLLLVYRVEADRQMTWHSRRAGGQALITEGVFADGETRSEWYQRCPNGIPTP